MSFVGFHRPLAVSLGSLVGLLLATVGVERAWAAPTPVVIVNLAHDQDAGAAAASQVRKTLETTTSHAANPAGDLSRALEAPLVPGGPQTPVLQQCEKLFESSDAAMRQFQLRKAREELESSRAKLLSLDPSPEVMALLERVGFEMALVHLREQNHGLALGELHLVHRLDPNRPPLDPVRYPPDVLKADRDARTRAATTAMAEIEISATYDGARIFVDGTPAGTTPARLKLSAGKHLLSLSSPMYEAHNILIDLDRLEEANLKVELKPLTAVSRALALRYQALAAPSASPPEREAHIVEAAERAARLANTDTALVISDSDDGLTVQVLQVDHGKLSYAVSPGDRVLDLLALLSPVATPELIEIPIGPGEEPSWYETRWGIASLGGGAVLGAVAILSLVLGDTDEPDVTIDFDWFGPSSQ